MASNVKNIIPPKYAETSQTTQYTSTASKTIINQFSLANQNTVPVSIAINIVKSGDSASNVNRVIPSQSVFPGKSIILPTLIGESLEPGDFISTIASAVDSITISATGTVIT